MPRLERPQLERQGESAENPCLVTLNSEHRGAKIAAEDFQQKLQGASGRGAHQAPKRRRVGSLDCCDTEGDDLNKCWS